MVADKDKKDNEEAEVIEVKTSRKATKKKPEKEKPSKDTVEEDSGEEKDEVITEEVKEEKKDSEEASDSAKAAPEAVSSFSLLDSDKSGDDSPTAETEKPDKKEEIHTIEKGESGTEKLASTEDVKDWLKDVKSDETDSQEETKTEGKGKKIFFVILILAVFAGAVGGGIYYYQTKVALKPSKPQPVVKPIVQPTNTPTPTAAEETREQINPAEYSVNVLNGSGIPGEAGTVKDLLSIQGFEDIKTGNAKTYDYESTEVSLKPDTPQAVYRSIKEALSKFYIVIISDTELDEDSPYDIVVTVGSDKAPTPTPTETE